jgi:hypothetical protein
MDVKESADHETGVQQDQEKDQELNDDNNCLHDDILPMMISEQMKRSFQIRDCLCLHGSISSNGFTNPLFIHIYNLQMKILRILDDDYSSIDSKINSYYSELIHFCLTSPQDGKRKETSQLFFAAAVESIHGNQQEHAKRFYDAGCFFEGFQQQAAADANAEGSQQQFINCFLSEEVEKPPSFLSYLRIIQSLVSRDSLVHGLRAKIPCECLSDPLLRSYSDRYDWPATWE